MFLLWLDKFRQVSDGFVVRDFQLHRLYLISHIFTYIVKNKYFAIIPFFVTYLDNIDNLD